MKKIFIVVLMSTLMVMAIPVSYQQTNIDLKHRTKKVIGSWINEINLVSPDLCSEAPSNILGSWSHDATKYSFRKIAAGLYSIMENYNGNLRIDDCFISKTNEWIIKYAIKHKRAGSDLGNENGDYDFYLIQIIKLLYLFRDRPDLLSNDAVYELVANDRKIPPFPGQENGFLHFLKTIYPIQSVPYSGQSPAGGGTMVFQLAGLSFAETENHVIMVNVWRYLINQWIKWQGSLPENHLRYDSRIKSIYNENNQWYTNEGGSLEEFIINMCARIVHTGYFETNSRAYQAFSFTAILALYSFVDDTTPGGLKVKTAAQNALDYTATKFIFQSIEAKRYGPMRRNHSYRRNFGLYSNDYMSHIMGMLTGSFTFDDGELKGNEYKCNDCAYGSSQTKGFALWAAILKYRVPNLLIDFALNRDNHKNGYGFWARMQTRFCGRHYLKGHWSRYLPGGNYYSFPDLAGEPLEVSPEFYFVTQDFLNVAGGEGDHYPSFDGYALTDEQEMKYDFWTKPTALIPSGNINWGNDMSSLTRAIPILRGEFDFPDDTKNLGVYKNFAFGYITHVPGAIDPPYDDFLGGETIEWGDAFLAVLINNDFPNHYILCTLLDHLGTWEILPKEGFYLENWKLLNPAQNFRSGSNINYTLYKSGETLTLNKNYGAKWKKNPFLSFKKNGSGFNINKYHINIESMSDRLSIPLIEVYQVDNDFEYTGIKYVQNSTDGNLIVYNPYLNEKLIINSSDWKNPYSNNPERFADEYLISIVPTIISPLLLN